MQESYWVKLKDPNKFRGVESALDRHGRGHGRP